MKRSRFAAKQIIAILKHQENAVSATFFLAGAQSNTFFGRSGTDQSLGPVGIVLRLHDRII